MKNNLAYLIQKAKILSKSVDCTSERLSRYPGMFGENLRYLLWREGVPRDKWQEQGAEWCGTDLRRAKELLADAPPSTREIANLCRVTYVSEEELVVADLVSDSNVKLVDANVRYLVSSLEYGRKTDLARAVGVHLTTISRWSSGQAKPSKAHLAEIAEFFHLPVELLHSKRIFISNEPEGIFEQKAWLQDRIRDADPSTMKDLYPALKKMFGKE